MKKRIVAVLSVVLVVAMLSVVLVGCFAPKTVEDAIAKLEKKGYTVGGVGSGYGNITFSKDTEDGLLAGNATLFENKEDADALYAKKKEASDAIEAEYKNALDGLNAKLKEAKTETAKGLIQDSINALKTAHKQKVLAVKQSGNWIAFGNPDAIKDLF